MIAKDIVSNIKLAKAAGPNSSDDMQLARMTAVRTTADAIHRRYTIKCNAVK